MRAIFPFDDDTKAVYCGDLAMQPVAFDKQFGAVLVVTGFSQCAGMLLSRVKDRRAEVELIAAKYGAKNVRVFGSAARGEDKEGSDIDLVVDFDEGAGLMALAGLERELADLLEVAVDVVPSNSLKPRVRVAVDREAVAS